MSKIAYHLKDRDPVYIDFDEDDLEHDELKGQIAFCILESLKAQNVLDMAVRTSDDNETINLFSL